MGILRREGLPGLKRALFRVHMRSVVDQFNEDIRFAPTSARPHEQSNSCTHFCLIFISGEWHTPGNQYRVTRHVDAACAAGAKAYWMTLDEAPNRLNELSSAQAVVIWRAGWDERLEAAVTAAKQGGALVIFDSDDLIFDPDLARASIIDGIRTNNVTEIDVRKQSTQLRRTMLQADLCTAATEELAWHMRAAGKPAVVLPNGFADAALDASRLAVRRRQQLRNDGIVRIGYAIGSRNHQRDFAVVASALAAILRERPQCRLVLFKNPQSGFPCLDITEFPEWADLGVRVEWRDVVPLDLLPTEMARFDVNLAPLEVGNPFCEAKSELTFFEAALVDVVTVASPTGPFCRVIREGETGFVAGGRDEWRVKLLRLVDDPALRRRMARAAKHDAMRRFGPMQQAKSMAAFIAQLSGGRDSAYAFEFKASRLRDAPQPLPKVQGAEIVFEKDELCPAKVTVIVPHYNYGHFVAEALDSVRAQSLAKLDLVIVDDCSTDDSLDVLLGWVRQNAERFNRLVLFRNQHNVGLGPSRNVGFDAAETRFILPLDADNRLLPECCERLLAALEGKDIAFAYPTIKQFGHSSNLINAMPYEPARFIGGNFIDAMALVSKEAWASVGGYEDMRLGWEDYDFWCRLAEQGFRGTWVQQTLAEYRVHPSSMIRTTRAHPERKRLLIDDMTRRHPWLALIERGAPPSASDLVKQKGTTIEDP